MTRSLRSLTLLLLAGVLALSIDACGGSSSSSSSSSSQDAGGGSGSSGGTVRMVESALPTSLDPDALYSTEGSEVDWNVYLGLVTYAHASGTAGTRLIPGLATALPRISDGGKTYTATLRKGLVFSDGSPVVASDFTHALERDIKAPYPASGEFITPLITGAEAYSTGKSKTISGITTNDRTGTIVIHLTAPYGPFDNVLALPNFGLVPKGSPMKNESLDPPPGVGPYMITHIVPNRSYEVVKNPQWARMSIPGIPAGHVNQVDVTINPNTSANALSVLNNDDDILDWADSVPGSVLAQVKARAADRYRLVDTGGTTYAIFMNTHQKPFSSQLAREAVVTGLNQDAMNKLGAGTLDPGCFFLPPAVPGHPENASCPYGTPGAGNLAKARALVKQSGMEGQHVTVWSEQTAPFQAWMTYYAQFLNQIGFKAKLQMLSDAAYYSTIGALKTHAQTGSFQFFPDFLSPLDYYGIEFSGKAILPTGNFNLSLVNDPYVNAQIAKLRTIPTTQLQKNSGAWQRLDEYVAKKAYVAVFGYLKTSFFTSNRIDRSSLVISPLYGWDFTSFQLR